MMSKNRIRQKYLMFVAICLVSLVPYVPALAQEAKRALEMESAQKSLSNYVQNVVTEKNSMRFGFKSPQEARSARVGEPMGVKMIGLQNLKDFKKGNKASSLFTDTKTLWFPVLVDGNTKAKLEMTEKEGVLAPGEFGTSKTALKISSARNLLPRLLATSDIRDVKTTLLIKIPSLAAEFIYVESAQGEFFIPAMVNPERLNIEDGKLLSAEDLLSSLHEIAVKIDPNQVM